MQPYERIWQAICRVESNNDPLAWHLERNGLPALGIAQIMQSRLDDYNTKTGKHLRLTEMYNPQKAKSVFMLYAIEIGPYDYQRIARCWNGGKNGMHIKQTYSYYLKIKKYL